MYEWNHLHGEAAVDECSVEDMRTVVCEVGCCLLLLLPATAAAAAAAAAATTTAGC